MRKVHRRRREGDKFKEGVIKGKKIRRQENNYSRFNFNGLVAVIGYCYCLLQSFALK
jgi:hypothetical protein